MDARKAALEGAAFLVPGAGVFQSGAIVGCQILFKVLTDRMLGSDSVSYNNYRNWWPKVAESEAK